MGQTSQGRQRLSGVGAQVRFDEVGNREREKGVSLSIQCAQNGLKLGSDVLGTFEEP